MGEARNRMMNGLMPQGPKQQQIQIQVKDEWQRKCECGAVYFRQLFKAFVIPALVSPTGKEHLVNGFILVCDSCGKELKIHD